MVGRDGGYTAKIADACVIIPTVNPETVTPHTEAFQAVVWHLIVSHPDLKKNEMKWEGSNINKAVFLDRDGVINKNIFYKDSNEWESPRNISDFYLLDNVIESLNLPKIIIFFYL